MLDTYVQNQGEAKGASCDTNRLESALLAHVMVVVGVRYVCAYTYTSGGDSSATRRAAAACNRRHPACKPMSPR